MTVTIGEARAPFIPERTAGTSTEDIEAGRANASEKQPSPSPSGEGAIRGGIDLEWRGVNCFVAEAKKQGRVAKWLGLEESMGLPTKQIITDACGFARAGEVLALMGPSGSGKTTLLNVISQRPTLGQRGYWEGELLLNGGAPWKDWERDMAYVMQKDIFYEELKVCENLWTTAMLRLPHTWTKTRKAEHLNKVVEGLGLAKVQNTKIGTAIERGLSGGEVKRTSIANECLSLPRIFLLDEPLTGLDSSRAVEVMTSLRRMAREEGTTVMLTIHQPSSALYECFDRLMLMAPGGRMAYFGAVSEAVAHFTRIGFPLPAMWTPSDHFIEVLADTETSNRACEAWAASPKPTAPAPSPRPPSLTPMPPFVYQVKVLLPRAFKRIQRSYLKRLNWKMQIGLALVWGMIYFGVGRDIDHRLTDFVGAIFFIVAHWSWTPLFQGLGNFPMEKDMLTKERASKVYDVGGFFSSQVLAEAPILMVFPAVFFVIIWPMASLPAQVAVQVFVFIALNVQVCSSLSMLISAACMDQDTAISTAIVVMVLEMCSGGYFADMRLLPWWIGWVRYTSIYYYTFGACLRLLVAVPFGEEVHKRALAKYSFSDLGYVLEVLALLCMIVFFRAAAYIQLRFSKKLRFH